jgi:hypothetical protein
MSTRPMSTRRWGSCGSVTPTLMMMMTSGTGTGTHSWRRTYILIYILKLYLIRDHQCVGWFFASHTFQCCVNFANLSYI